MGAWNGPAGLPLQNIVGHPTKFYLSVRRKNIFGIGSKNYKNCEYGPRIYSGREEITLKMGNQEETGADEGRGKFEEERRGEEGEGRSVIIAPTLDGIHFLAAS